MGGQPLYNCSTTNDLNLMETLNPELFRAGTKVSLPDRYGADGKLHPALTTIITEDAWKNQAGLWVCRVLAWGQAMVRIDKLTICTR